MPEPTTAIFKLSVDEKDMAAPKKPIRARTGMRQLRIGAGIGLRLIQSFPRPASRSRRRYSSRNPPIWRPCNTTREAFALVFRHFALRLKAWLTKSGATPGAAGGTSFGTQTDALAQIDLIDTRKADAVTWILRLRRSRAG